MEEKMKNWRSQFMEWLKEICPWDKVVDYCEFVSDSNPPMETKVRIYTHDYRYAIVAKESSRPGHIYLGCQVSCRKPRAGEHWTRGSDLPDGEFNRETWEKIKNGIMRYELVKIVKPQKPIADTPK